VTHKAAQVLQAFPNASANLIRAFLANSARVPQPPIDKLGDIKIEELMSVCGYGMASADRAVTSTENRVILFTESEMPMDWFFVYEVPIPMEYAQTNGKRHIAVTLAYDPPTVTAAPQFSASRCLLVSFEESRLNGFAITIGSVK
jgi:hypothetical protein